MGKIFETYYSEKTCAIDLLQSLAARKVLDRRCRGFSFAEVMITLVIIGVISLLVVPNIMDSSTSKVNVAAAQKAKLDAAQAALILQTKCPRLRCSDLSDKLNDLFQNGDSGTYKIKAITGNGGTKIIADVDGDNAIDLSFTVDAKGNITEDTGCKIDDYNKNGKNANCKVNNSTKYKETTTTGS